MTFTLHRREYGHYDIKSEGSYRYLSILVCVVCHVRCDTLPCALRFNMIWHYVGHEAWPGIPDMHQHLLTLVSRSLADFAHRDH